MHLIILATLPRCVLQVAAVKEELDKEIVPDAEPSTLFDHSILFILQVAALKEELNKEIELNAELHTEVCRRRQYDYLALGAAVLAAVGAMVLFNRRR